MAGSHTGMPVTWAKPAADAPDGPAVVDAAGRFVQVNRAGARLCGRAAADLVGTLAPFALAPAVTAEPTGLFDDDPGEQVTTWVPPNGHRREIAYRVQRMSGDPDRMEVLAQRGGPVPAEVVRRITNEVGLDGIRGERAEDVYRTTVAPGRRSGTVVRLVVPLTVGIPVGAPASTWRAS